ncbi:FAD:protein FMN transferase [Streptacidiphilus carbonis]|uniref:FAD:protein FMN transferase n=1 Tax=Streptacidiphilus carbonis TaxID=105422 RepID=UPI0005A971DB|nr:FAD:protein FMN transferase [Streptacidiphilus carbonis]
MDRPVLRHAEPVMGTVVSFDVRAPDGAAADALRRAVDWLHRVDGVFSTYRPDSQISRLGRGELTVADCDPEVAEVLALGAAAERAGDGFFSVRPGGPDGALDPSGVVKGWAVERASRILLEAGSTDHSVNGGGDVQTAGEAEPGRGWSLAVAHPLHPGAFATLVRGSGIALATSGTAERGAHILDPHTGRPASGGLASVSVVGKSLTAADIAATTAFAMGPAGREWLASQPGLEGFAVTADGRAWWTPGFRAYVPEGLGG